MSENYDSDLLTSTLEWQYINDNGMLTGDAKLDNCWTINEVTGVMRSYKEWVLKNTPVKTVIK